MQITGKELLIKALRSEDVDTLFAYPGGKVVSIFDELYRAKDIRVILPRHEQALIHASDGYARSTGKVGVSIVTSGPGATNAVTGIATAYYDSVPLVCFTGQVPMGLIGNDAFQEVDIVGITRSITKHSVIVTEREDLGRIIKEAFYIAKTGKPGPVVVDLPTDIMDCLGSDLYPETVNIRSYKPTTNVHIGQLKKAVSLLKSSQRPLFLAGGGINISHAEAEFTRLAEKTNIPVVTTIMGKGSIPTEHELYIGNLGMHGSYAANNAVSQCDLLFSIGTRFNDRITGKIDEFAPKARIVHIDIDTASISRNIKVDIPIVADAKLAILELLNYAERMEIKEWLLKINNWEQEHPLQTPNSIKLSPIKIIQELNRFFREAIVVTDVGQHQMWTTQFLELNKNKKLLTSGGLGTMGYGLPAAIGAQIGNRDTKVICIAGDGGIQMNIQELATAVLEELPIIILIFNNGYLGMVRQWQQFFYENRYSSTDLLPNDNNSFAYTPDFVKLAESYGAIGIRVSDEAEIKSAFQTAMAQSKVPIIIECVIDREANVLPMVKSGSPLNEMILEVSP